MFVFILAHKCLSSRTLETLKCSRIDRGRNTFYLKESKVLESFAFTFWKTYKQRGFSGILQVEQQI